MADVYPDPEALRAWWLSRGLPSKWRRKAREVIGFAILANEGATAPAPLMVAIDEAYPFGERVHHPYKAWLAERRLIAAVLFPAAKPTDDDVAACEVALDLVEMGRDDEARALLAEQAPNRHSRTCLACGAAIGRPCFDLVMEVVDNVPTRPMENVVLNGKLVTRPLPGARQVEKRMERVVPHLVRVGVAPTGAALGPLFGAPAEGGQ